MKIDKRTVLYSTFFLTLSSFALQLLGFLYRVILGRLAGAEGMGVHQLAMSAHSVIMSVTLSGLTMAISRISAQCYAKRHIAAIYRLVRTCICIFLILFTAAAVPVTLFSENIAINMLGDVRTRYALLLLLPCLFFTGFENIFKNCFYGTQMVFPPIVSELLEQVVRIVASLVLLTVFRSDDPAQIAALVVAATVVSEIFSSTTLRLFYKKRLPKPQSPLPSGQKFGVGVGDILAIAVPLSMSGLINNLLSSANRILIPQKLVLSGMTQSAALSEFGIMFSMTIPLLAMPSAFLFPLTTVLVPRISEGNAMKNTTQIKRKSAKAIHFTGLLSFFSMALMMVLGPQLATLLYDQPLAGHYIVPLAISTIFNFYQVVTASILNGIGLQKRVAACIIVEGVIELLFTLFAVGNPKFGMKGFVAGAIVSTFVACLINFVSVVHKVQLKVRWKNWFGIPIFCSVLTGLSVQLLYSHLKPGWGGVLLCIVMGGLLYLLLLRLCGLDIKRYLKTLEAKEH